MSYSRVRRICLGLVLWGWAGWLSAQYATAITVAQDGSGDFTTIQAALDATKAFPDERITISVQPGVYTEKVEVYAWNDRVTLRGEDPATTIIRWGDSFDGIERGRNSTFHTATLRVQGEAFRAENLTIENTAGAVGQAIAVSVEADRVVFSNCRFLGNQDTLYAAGDHTRQHYVDCYIEGTTDFIFGAATALFEGCIIHSKSNSFITAASTPAGRPYGFVFLDCRLTAAPGVDRVYLGRPWRDFAKTVFLRCELGEHIRPEGWDNWSTPHREQTTFYAEYDNRGPGADRTDRAPWSHELTNPEAARYQPRLVLAPFALPLFDSP